jgi:hypothetical protein
MLGKADSRVHRDQFFIKRVGDNSTDAIFGKGDRTFRESLGHNLEQDFPDIPSFDLVERRTPDGRAKVFGKYLPIPPVGGSPPDLLHIRFRLLLCISLKGRCLLLLRDAETC